MLRGMATLKVTRRDDWTLVLDLSQASTPPPDLSGVKLFFTLKRNYYNPDEQALVEFDSEVPPDDNARSGVAFMIVPHGKTDVPAGLYFYDVQWILPGSAELTATPFNGRCRVSPDVTIRRVPA